MYVSIVHECIYVAHVQILHNLICVCMYASQGHMKHNYTYTYTNKSHTVFTICHNEYWCVHIHTTSTQEMNVHNNYVQTY